jgi:putative peptidoglycan lipid II flippase
LKLALLIAVPAAIGLFVLAGPLVAALFYGGVFDENAVRMTAMALKAYAVGLVGFSFVKILAPAYFAREDTKTPVRIALLALAVNLILSIGLAWYLSFKGFAGPHAGLAAATSVAAILNAALLYRGLLREKILLHSRGWPVLMVRVVLANAAMYVMLHQLYRPLEWWLGANFTARAGWLAVTIGTAAASYFLALILMGTRLSQFRLRAD